MKRQHYQNELPAMVELSIAGKTDEEIATLYRLNPKTVSSWLGSRQVLVRACIPVETIRRLRLARRTRRFVPHLRPGITEIIKRNGTSVVHQVRRYGYRGGRAWYRSDNYQAVSWQEDEFEAILFALAGFDPKMPREAARECISDRVEKVELAMMQKGPSKRDISILTDEILRLSQKREAGLLGKRSDLSAKLNILAAELQHSPEDPTLLLRAGCWWMDYLRCIGITNKPRWLVRLFSYDVRVGVHRVAQDSSYRSVRIVWHENERTTDYETAIFADIEPDGTISTFTREFANGGTLTTINEAIAAERRRSDWLARIRRARGSPVLAPTKSRAQRVVLR
ncbi:MAG TPA: hypothetical protein PLS03_02420 [Terrimicrobiaceae bacterium]|nr:hypothetical protein [Terrimicrobiaceae bacterium]